ncbi:cytochrome P450, partial [Pyrenochaeta sp. MPI-SDFR-AT-0127]
PGPPTRPILGNLLEFPTTNIHFQFTEWAQQYGGIYSLKLAYGTAIVLTDRRLIRELFDKRGAIYNSRPQSFIGKTYLTPGDSNIVFLPYSDRLRLCRKLIMHHFNEARVEQRYMGLVEAEASQMLSDFCTEPDKVMMHPKRFSNSIIMSIVFGTRTKHADTEHLKKHWEAVQKWSSLLEAGATPPMDLLPFLQYIPEKLWVGRWKDWKSRAEETGKTLKSCFSKLAEPVLKRRECGIVAESFCDYLFDQCEQGLDFKQEDLIVFAGAIVDGGSDTPASVLLVFIQAMLKHPHVQERAQQAIDKVIGKERSPRWEDYEQLPYISQIVKETMRWRPVVSVVPHATTTGDVIDGYIIPKDTIVFINIWGLNNSPASSDNSELPMSEFDPDRYTNRHNLASYWAASPDFSDRDHYLYGAGRRLCPGIHQAERTLFVAVVKLLWAFEFR